MVDSVGTKTSHLKKGNLFEISIINIGIKIGFLFDALRPINNLSVKQGWVFLG